MRSPAPRQIHLVDSGQGSAAGDRVVKRALIGPVRARRRRVKADKAEVKAIAKRGTLHAREVASATLVAVKSAMGFTYFD